MILPNWAMSNLSIEDFLRAKRIFQHWVAIPKMKQHAMARDIVTISLWQMDKSDDMSTILISSIFKYMFGSFAKNVHLEII